jgi:hypothetical protein
MLSLTDKFQLQWIKHFRAVDVSASERLRAYHSPLPAANALGGVDRRVRAPSAWAIWADSLRGVAYHYIPGPAKKVLPSSADRQKCSRKD